MATSRPSAATPDARPSYSPAYTPYDRFSLTSRRRAPQAHGVKPAQAYNPAAVLAARAQSSRTSSPPKFKRRVPRRTDPFTTVTPMQQWRNEQAENHWQRVDVCPSMHNDVVHKAQQRLFSHSSSIVGTTETLLQSTAVCMTLIEIDDVSALQWNVPASHVAAVAGIPVKPSTLPSRDDAMFRPRTSDPLLGFLESSWMENDKHTADANEELTLTKRHLFDSPQRATRVPLFDAEGSDARLLIEEGLRTKSHRDKLHHGARGRARAGHRRQVLDLAKPHAEPKLRSDLFRDSSHQQQRAHSSTSPARVLDSRRVPLARGLPNAATNKGELLLAPPPPSFLHHPHSNFYRHVPKKRPTEVIADLKKERDWNERHQLPHVIDGWL